MSAQEDRLTALLAPAVTGLGYELVGIEYLPAGKQSVLRIYIDSDDGILVEDCERVSRQVSAVLDVEDPIRGAYTLEVSSPGIDRPLFTPEHYARFIGQPVRVQLIRALDGRRKFKGEVEAVDEEGLTLVVDGERVRLGFDLIEKGRLVA